MRSYCFVCERHFPLGSSAVHDEQQFLDLETLSLPGLQEREKSLLEDVKNGGEEES